MFLLGQLNFKCNWSSERYNNITEKLGALLPKIGFPKQKTRFLPVSGLIGVNLTKRATCSPSNTTYSNVDDNPVNDLSQFAAWYKDGPSLLELIDEIPIPSRVTTINTPTRLVITTFKNTKTCLDNMIRGKIEAGFISNGDKLLLMPLGKIVTVKEIRELTTTTSGSKPSAVSVEYAYAGSIVDIGLVNADIEQISLGSVLCDPQSPISHVNKFMAQIITFGPKLPCPILVGSKLLLHVHVFPSVPAIITKLVSVVEQKTNQVLQKQPKTLAPNASAVIVLSCEKPVLLELYSNIKPLGRFTLRDQGKSVAAGIVTEIISTVNQS